MAKTSYFFLQQGAARIAEEEKRVRESKGEECDMTLKNNIEGIIIKWAYQTDEVNLTQNYEIFKKELSKKRLFYVFIIVLFK